MCLLSAGAGEGEMVIHESKEGVELDFVSAGYVTVLKMAQLATTTVFLLMVALKWNK